MYTIKALNMTHGCYEIFESCYRYHVGEIVYPFELRPKYPGYNENRHRVVACAPGSIAVIEQYKDKPIPRKQKGK